MNGGELLVSALENEGVTQIFGLPGEENLPMVEALRRSSIKLVVTRHEQAAAFMAATHGRLTGRRGVCLQDDAFGMIRWKQETDGFPDFGMSFGNPDFVAFAKAHGVEGSRVESAGGLAPTLEAAFAGGGVHLVVAPVDYSENKRVLIDELGAYATKEGRRA